MAVQGDDGSAQDAFQRALDAAVERGEVVRGARALYRPGQLVLSDRAVQLLGEELSSIADADGEQGEWLGRVGLQLWRIVRGEGAASLVETATRLQGLALTRAEERRDGESTDREDPPITVSLNHVLVGQPHPRGGPAGPPTATAAHRRLDPAAERAVPDIAVLDTGVPTHKLLSAWHPNLDAAIRRDPANPVFHDDEDRLYPAGAPVLGAEAGHGTFIAGLVRRVAPDLVISPYAVLDPDGIGDDVWVARALLAVGTRPMAVPVISLSLGGYTFDDNPPVVTQAVLDRLPRTTVVVAAAGNDGIDRPWWPAAFADVVAVAAVDDADGVVAPTSWSNFGPWVDVCTLGQDLLSTYVEGTYPSGATFTGPHTFARWSGTSFAAPLVAGLIAAQMSNASASAADATATVLAQAAAQAIPGLGPVLYPWHA
jgi:hypothetical protein